MTDSAKQKTLSLHRGDITRLSLSAIVNAANTSLLGGGGVDGAIHRAAGPELVEACATLGGCPTGEAKMTEGFRLPAGFVIHTVGPVWQDGGHGEPDLLRSCYTNSLDLCRQHSLEEVAFPAISTGVFGYPADLAAAIALDTCLSWLDREDMPLHVVLVSFSEGAHALLQTNLDKRSDKFSSITFNEDWT